MVQRRLKICDEQRAEEQAEIFGAESGLARALESLKTRRANGERVALFEDEDGSLWVGVVPAELDPANKFRGGH